MKISSLKFVLVTILLTGQYFSCSTGCLQCSEFGSCLVADFINMYYVTNGVSTLAIIPNCLFIDNLGNCIACSPGFYYLSAGKGCFAVSSSMTNCEVASESNTCLYCVNLYVVVKGSCVPVTKIVDNCWLYAFDGVCYLCKEGHVTDVRGDCVPISSTTLNCSSLTFLNCTQCSSGFFLGQPTSPLDIGSSTDVINELIAAFVPQITFSVQKICNPFSDSNCSSYSSLGFCLVCNPGYCPDTDSNCVLCPLTPISDCVTYLSPATCFLCSNGYYLSSGACVSVGSGVISGCQKYDGSASLVTCLECYSYMYLNGSTCLFRTYSAIPKCIQYSLTSDQCSTCLPGTSLVGNGLHCVNGIRGCLTYDSYISGQLVLLCLACADGYYLNQKIYSCEPGRVPGCLQYSGPMTCTLCDSSSHYLNDGNTCSRHVAVPDCLTYSLSSPNKCLVCKTGSFSVTFDTECLPVASLVLNCSSYDSKQNCTGCIVGFYLRDSICQLLPSNCLEADLQGNCTRCIDGLLLQTSLPPSSCVITPSFISTNCSVTPSNTPTQLIYNRLATGDYPGCSSCSSNKYPVRIPKKIVCVHLDELSTAETIDPAVNQTYCNRYRFNPKSNLVECIGCVDNYNIKGVSTTVYAYGIIGTYDILSVTCSTDVPNPNSYTLVLSLHFSLSNFYVSQSLRSRFSIPGCLVAEVIYDPTNTSQNPLGLACVKYTLLHIIFYVNNFFSDINTIGTNIILGTDPFGNIVNNDLFFKGYTFYAATSVLASQVWNHNLPVTDTSVFACELSSLTLSTFICIRCKWGYSVKFDGSKTTCVQISDCNTTSKYSGLGYKLNTYLSCHTCTTSGNKIVLTLQDVTNISVHVSIRSTMVPVRFATDNTTSSVTCLPSGVASVSTYTTINNCLIYYHRLNSSNQPIYNDVAAAIDANFNVCVACSKGYLPLNLTADTFTCATTPYTGYNSTTNSINIAGPCLKDYNNYTLKSDFSACLPAVDSNCLVSSDLTVVLNGQTLYKCTVCNAGYFADIDGRCIMLQIPNCSNNNSISVDLPLVTSNTVMMIVKFFSNIYTVVDSAMTIMSNVGVNVRDFKVISNGCSLCSNGFVGLYLNGTTNHVCLANSYLATSSSSVVSGSSYINNCLMYNVNAATVSEARKCYECNTGFVPTVNRSSCVSAPSNCFLAVSGSQCSICVPGYSTDNGGVCRQQIVSNCQSYSPGTGVISCSICNPSYYLRSSDGTCQLGQLTYCSTYASNSSSICLSCMSNAIQYTDTSGRVHCISNADDLGCASGSLGPGPLFAFTCNTCSVGNHIAPIVNPLKPKSKCLDLMIIINCVAYDDFSVSGRVTPPTFVCLKCSSTHYLSTNSLECIPRSYISFTCASYSLNSDVCLTCRPGFFLSSGICLLSPTGIAHCAIYRTTNECKYCIGLYYPDSQGTCLLSGLVALPSECLYLASASTCGLCNSTHFLSPTNATCQLITAKDCHTLLSPTSCLTCDPNNRLYTLVPNSSSGLDCILTSIPNCLSPVTGSTSKCLNCLPSFYADSTGTCVQGYAIPGCRYNKDKSTCMTCLPEFVLLTSGLCDQRLYSSSSDPNCEVNSEVSSPICQQCNHGYYLSDQKCVELKSMGTLQGCWVHSSNEGACVVCRPGYTIDLRGICTTTVFTASMTGSETTESESVNNQDTSGMQRRSMIASVLLLLLVITLR